MRMGIASHSNDHRLGANEAPPSIMSVFLGDTLNSIVQAIISGSAYVANDKKFLDLGAKQLANLAKDNTDRNRTSPFAFTGNKFEFRVVGSSANCANAMTTLNSIVAKQLKEFKKEVDALIDSKGLKKDEAIFNVLREYIKQTKNILFEGDGYSVDIS